MEMENQEHTDEVLRDKVLFWGCFTALVATSFAFILRALLLNEWGVEFNLTNTQKGEIAGVGLWPFAISIVLFSLVIDKIGYKKVMVFAFACHVISAIGTIYATGFWMLYGATFIMALANGAVEAAINPVVATMFPKEKTKWLNILHAGWPGGLVIGGILALFLGTNVSWQMKIGLLFIPTITYGVILFNRKFPVSERVKAGVSYLDMLKEVGILGAIVVVPLLVFQVGSVFEWSLITNIIVSIVLIGIYGYYVRSLGQPLFFFLLLIMIPLATTELGTDSWITDLMTRPMEQMGMQAGWVLVYTSAIMLILRFFAGSIVHRISPLGLLAVSATIAIIGLVFLSYSAGITILIAATIYGVGKTFFWPTTLGLVAEQFPKGGALTLNVIAGVGMIGVGVVGAVVLGFMQDKALDNNIALYDTQNQTALHETFVTETKTSIFGEYSGLNQAKLEEATPEQTEVISDMQAQAKKDALRNVAIFPAIMLVCYLILIFYFRSKGGYKPVVLEDQKEKQTV